MKRKLALLLSIVLLCCFTAGCTMGGRKNIAMRIIDRDLSTMIVLAEKILDEGTVPEDVFIEGVESVTYVAPDWVAFCTGSRGEGSTAAYTGFYYSRADRPMGYEGAEMELKEEDLGWTWKGKDDGNRQVGDGKNRYYTRYIQENWYYYEMYS